jgi:LPLT family lysophospholipid transporter-like MFS transporter
MKNRNLVFVLLSQFFSALADNILFITAIAYLKVLYGSETPLLPYLQESFVIAFILLAPFVGVFADAIPKNKVMIISNSIKITGAIFMVLNFNTLFSYLIVGVGAAIYSPAKYGILVQLLPKEQLVKANSLMEGSTIIAILLGVVAGGLLIDYSSIESTFQIVVGIYLLATILNLFISTIKVEHKLKSKNIVNMIKLFFTNIKILFSDKETRIAILGTSTFWGVGSMLRVFLFAWIPFMFHIKDNSTPSNLMGALSIGIVIGAIFASRYFNLKNAMKSIIFGVLLGISIVILSFISNLYIAGLVLILLGVFGGLLVIPLNSLIQENGHEKIGAGAALSIQNFFENIFMLFIVGFYNIAIIIGIPLNIFLGLSGILLAGLMYLFKRSVSK